MYIHFWMYLFQLCFVIGIITFATKYYIWNKLYF